jgi:hypothetical protein
MSYEQGRRQDGTSNSRSGTAQGMVPGKTTLTEGLLQQQATPGAEPGKGPTTAALRDVSPAGGGPGVASTGAGGGGPAVANPGGGGEVAATVVGSAADSEYAFDNSFTPALVAALQANPNLNIDDVLRQLAAAPLGTGADNSSGLHHPTIVQYGQAAPSTSEPRDNKKLAVLVGNQNYVNINSLSTPIAEAGTMQSELASRGYDANVHADKTAADMTTLWGSMVGAANKGDDLVAFYGGHGAPEGLIGINHDVPPNPSDIFTNSQVSGVVSSATGKGAHIRFVMDSCHSGAAAQAVREVRENELAAVATSVGDQLRVAAMTGLRKAKERILALLAQRETILSQLDHEIEQRSAHAPAAAQGAKRDVVVEGLADARTKLPNAFERAVDKLWAEYVPLLMIVKTAVGYTQAPPPIGDYRTLGAQLNYLDALWNSVSQPMERATAAAGAAGAAGAKKPPAPAAS